MKKIFVMIMMLLPFGMAAQEVKIAYVNTVEIFNIMPEVSAMETEMAAFRTQYQNYLKQLYDEYTQKNSDLIAQQDSLTENILKMRVQEIQDLQGRIENYQQLGNQEQEEKYEKLFTPIQEKLFKAIEQVGEENGYTYILNPQALLYKSKSAIDATDKVKAKLGLQ